MLNWLVSKHGIEPHIPVFDKSQHADGTFSRDDFATTTPLIPTTARPGKPLQHYRRRFAVLRTGIMKDNSPVIRIRVTTPIGVPGTHRLRQVDLALVTRTISSAAALAWKSSPRGKGSGGKTVTRKRAQSSRSTRSGSTS